MDKNNELAQRVLMGARESNLNSVLFRNAMGRKLDLNITEYECLTFLGIKGTSTPTEISRYTGLTTGSTTTMLDRLEKKNFIRRKANPNDRRGVLIEVNEDYSKIAVPLVQDVQKAHRELIASYTDKELETIADFLNRFAENVIESAKKIEKKNS